VTPAPEIREAGDSALLLQFEAVIDPSVNAQVIAIAGAIRARGLAGVRDVVPTFRSVAVQFDPIAVGPETVTDLIINAAENAPATSPRAAVVELPVTYGGDAGPDLNDVASFARLSPQQVMDRHAAGEYRVYMLGFLPGFPYMAAVPAEIAMPRRLAPRLRVARGSVGIAGRQTGVYPMDSPGGWQIIGRTWRTLFDPTRTPAALLSPGDRVRFIPAGPGAIERHVERPDGPRAPRSARRATVLRPGMFTTIQDLGRWGFQSQGVPVSGAMDVVSHRVANALVGNDPAAATLEATLVGPELRVEQDTTVAIAGANLSATLDGAAVAVNAPVRCGAGSVIRFGERVSGTRAYIAFDGGVDTPLVLGSRSTHARSRMGGMDGRPLVAGDEVPLGPGRDAHRRRAAVAVAPAGGARVRVRPGPQTDAFPPT
jgi:KipI family sensor histidine kinase inhibitor